MRVITPLDMRRSLGRILDEASAGERFLIERDHQPLACIVSVEDAARLDGTPDEVRTRRLAAIAAVEEWRDRVAGQLIDDGVTAAATIRAGRDRLDARDRGRGASSKRDRSST